jgi:hypothetical protein
MQTELSLAHGIQVTLVPTVSFQNASFELYSKSIPSTEMGAIWWIDTQWAISRKPLAG